MWKNLDKLVQKKPGENPKSSSKDRFQFPKRFSNLVEILIISLQEEHSQDKAM